MRLCQFLFIVLWLVPVPAGAEAVEVRTAAGAVHTFQVEVADTPAERARGLMGRAALGPDSGMLFLFPGARDDAAFWMKDTLIPLDMLFFSEDGAVLALHENARALDETPIPAPLGTAAVLEIKGGTAARLSLAPGDRIQILNSQ